MADNSTLPVNSGTEVFANNDIAGIKYPRVKVTWGVAGASVDASATNPLPVATNADGTITAGAAPSKSLIAGGIYYSSPITLTNGQGAALQFDVNGHTLVKDAGVITAISTGASLPVPSGTNMIGHVGGTEYKTVAASQTDMVMGASGAAGDYLAGVLIVPGTTAAGAVSIKDGSGTAISIFAGGGTTALTTLIPFFVPLGIKCATSWKVTTGANVTVIGVGDFT